MNGEARHGLFCYGTLRDPKVQEAVFGRRLAGQADALRGYALAAVTIDGTAYRSLVASGREEDLVHGLVLLLREEDLAAADAYEGPTHYVRLTVRLVSGREAFVYLSADSKSLSPSE